MNIKKTPPRELPEEGTYFPMIIGIWGIGTQTFQNKNGGKFDSDQLMIGIELHDGDGDVVKMSNGKPFVLSYKLAAVTEGNSQYALCKFMKELDGDNWMSKYPGKSEDEIDLSPLLMRVIKVDIKHEKNPKTGQMYADTSYPRRFFKTDPDTSDFRPMLDPTMYDVREDGEGGAWNALPEWVQNAVKQSKEMQANNPWDESRK